MESKFEQIYYSNDGYWRGKSAIKNYLKHRVQQNKASKKRHRTKLMLFNSLYYKHNGE